MTQEDVLREPEPDQHAPSEADALADGMAVRNLSAWYGTFRAIADVSLLIGPQRITAIMGPSGCGKSTLIRCLNRMHEVAPRARASGEVLLKGDDIYAPNADVVQVRRRIGMVFQRPNPFPTMTIFENVAAGLRLHSAWMRRSAVTEVVERSLRNAALWDEVKDKVDRPATELSGGQQQRLCIARALAVQPEVLLMDEPCSALDPVATLKIEELMRELAKELTIVIVTHNMQQAARVSDYTAVMMMGEDRSGQMIEFDSTRQIFTQPREKRTEDYITGRFG
jgi:phosphate transport system ATP-binding protein